MAGASGRARALRSSRWTRFMTRGRRTRTTANGNDSERERQRTNDIARSYADSADTSPNHVVRAHLRQPAAPAARSARQIEQNHFRTLPVGELQRPRIGDLQTVAGGELLAVHGDRPARDMDVRPASRADIDG